MHRLVLENAESGLGTVEQRMAGLLDVAVAQGLDHLTISLGGETAHFVARGPPGLTRDQRRV